MTEQERWRSPRRSWSGLRGRASAGRSSAVLEAPAFVAGLNDIAVVSEAVEQRRRHLGIDEDGRPFVEGQIGRDDDGSALIESADEVEQQFAVSSDSPKRLIKPLQVIAHRLFVQSEIGDLVIGDRVAQAFVFENEQGDGFRAWTGRF